MRLLQIADNAGAMNEHRALNYLAVRYPVIYAKCAEECSTRRLMLLRSFLFAWM